jgi:hypothetical protein
MTCVIIQPSDHYVSNPWFLKDLITNIAAEWAGFGAGRMMTLEGINA